EQAALRTPADGAGHVEQRAHPAAARKDERAQRRELLLAAVHDLLERRHLGGADAEHARLERGRRGREFGAEVEELALQAPQHDVEFAARGRALELRGVEGPRYADG